MNSDESLPSAAMRIVTALRAGDSAEASSQLNLFLAAVQSVMQSGLIAPDRIMAALQTALCSLARRDWVALADTLEYHIVPLLPRS